MATATQLNAALLVALPGDVIELADGTYNGRFVIDCSETPANPITRAAHAAPCSMAGR